ncbi:TFIIB-type zinc ribbon-containing protein [Halobaculum lipolyticum]|uniref:TFIIB-type zinc ribbon-containing protein n=1 Tax=Halobaculum lipolyticum TaxID=3032001 RepID=A0ABD5WD71_9EURY|nr:TFIIB-type zinc ribbon-containing protein [Halobaculum sp. DT31]
MTVEISSPTCPNCGSEDASVDADAGEFWCDDCDLYGEFAEISPNGHDGVASD